MAKYPNVKIERTKKAFEDLQKTVKLAVSGDDAPDIVQANQGRPIMGEMVKAGLLRPVTDYAKVYGWEDRYSPTLLDLNKFSSDGAEFGSGDLYGLSQTGEIVGVFYNKEKVPTPPTTLDEFEASLQEAKDAGETPIMFGNLEEWPGIHNFESVLGQTADKQAVRDFVFAKDGASFDNPEFQAEAATKIVEWVDKGYFNKDFNGTKLRPGVAGVREGQEPLPDRGHVGDGRPRQGDGRQGRLHADARPGPERARVAGRRGPAVDDHRQRQEPRRGGGLHRLHHRRERGQGARRHGQPLPAMKGAPAPTEGVSVEVADAWQKLNEADGVIPYLDYTTPTFYDDISALDPGAAGRASRTRPSSPRASRRRTTSGRSPEAEP